MIGQTNHDAGGNAKARNLASAANAAAEQTGPGADEAMARLSRVATKPAPKNKRLADAQIRVENPSRSEEEIEERLAQFGV